MNTWACSWLPTLTSATSTTWHDTKEAADRAEVGLRCAGRVNVVVWRDWSDYEIEGAA